MLLRRTSCFYLAVSAHHHSQADRWLGGCSGRVSAQAFVLVCVVNAMITGAGQCNTKAKESQKLYIPS